MNYLTRLLLGLGLAIPMSGWAEDAGKFLNLYYKNNALYLAQEKKACTVGASDVEGYTCAKTQEVKSSLTVRGAINNVISGKWVSGTANASQYQSTELNLRTDIDFGQNKSDGTCSENHNFLPFSGLTFNGQYNTISNLCRVDKGNMINTASSKPVGVGLFGEISGNTVKTVKNLKISNVHFSVADEDANGDPASTNAGDYHAVGALSFKISNSEVSNVQLNDIVIQAPLAGGLAGYIEGSTISGITMVDKSSVIKISNERQIETGYIGSAVAGANSVVFNSNNPYKVLLGGVAGVAYFSNFKDINIAAQVKNEAVVDMSALGGLAGLYVYAPKTGTFLQTSDRNSEITNVNIHGYTSVDAGFVKPVISGGTAMGGVLGALRRADENNSPIVELAISEATVTKLEIKQSKVKISDADEPQPLYFGGIVGDGNLCSGGILQVTGSKVKDVDINELLPDDAAFQYYMGGIAGYASCSHANNSGNRDDMFLTLTGSEATGRILLSSSTNGKTALQHARVSAMLGGLVGNAMVSLEDNSTAGNKTEVSINYTAKRAKSVTAVDSVIVGGIFGAVSPFNSNTDIVQLSDLSSKGAIYVVDDGITARIGGIVGEFPLVFSGEPKIEFDDVHVDFRGGSIVTYSGENKASTTSSSIGGICGICRTPKLINHSSAEGSFTGTIGVSTAPQKTFNIGGLIGEADFHGSEEIVIKNNYYIGTIANKFNGGKGHAGYLFGYMHGDGLGSKPVLTSNYHYGADNVGAIGYFSNYGDFTNVAYFNEDGFNKFVAKNNVRNGADDLQDGPNGSTNNGYAPEGDMRSQDFVDFLNSAWTDPEDQVWAYENNYPTLIKPVVVGSSSSYNESSSSYESSSSSDVTSSSSDATSSSSDITSSSDGTSSSSANNGDSSSSYEESSSSNAASSSSDGTSSSSNETSSSSGESSSSSDVTSSSSDATSSSSNETSSSSENGTSSSSNEESSSSVEVSSSSSSAGNDSSSSSEDKSSSSSATSSSSSSVNDESSSSNAEHKKYLLEIAAPTATQDGNALRMEFGSQLANTSENVNIHIQVVSKNGIYLDTTVNGKAVSDVKNGTWRLDPAPAGRYTVTFMIMDDIDSIPVQKTFTSMESREVASHSWQTLSLSAFCREKGDECMSDLEAFFARHRDKAEGDVESETSVYWWDESTPIGEFWQYRKFSVNDKFDSTRGYWYGPIDKEPLVMSLETPNMKDTIVWHLENKYSGWNLVANPFGWYVALPKEKDLLFCQWDPEKSTYIEPDTLGPYEAIWVHTEKPMTYRIPLKAAIVLEGEKKSLNKISAFEDWNLRVVLADDNGKRDSWNELAAGKTASTLGEPPAGMGDRVNLSIVDGKKRLVKSVKKNADDLEWDLEVSATTSREGHLSFEGLESVWSKGLRVYATVDNETVEVVKDCPVDVKLSSKAKNVSVRVTKSAVAANVAKNLLKGLRVGQISNMLNVGFDAASKLAGANVKVSVVGIDGRVVATNRAVAREGSNAVSMKKPKQGVYFVKVKVGSQSAVTRIMVR